MTDVFISYRKADSSEEASRLKNEINSHFDRQLAFLDSERIPLGSDFPTVIEEELMHCKVLLAVIGPEWNPSMRNTTERRLDDPFDWIRLELKYALDRRIRLIPVLVGNAEMPRLADLPEELEPLARRQSTRLTNWKADLPILLSGLQDALSDPDSWSAAVEKPPSKSTGRDERIILLSLAYSVHEIRIRTMAKGEYSFLVDGEQRATGRLSVAPTLEAEIMDGSVAPLVRVRFEWKHWEHREFPIKEDHITRLQLHVADKKVLDWTRPAGE